MSSSDTGQEETILQTVNITILQRANNTKDKRSKKMETLIKILVSLIPATAKLELEEEEERLSPIQKAMVFWFYDI